jgi:hypothetical protein
MGNPMKSSVKDFLLIKVPIEINPKKFLCKSFESNSFHKFVGAICIIHDKFLDAYVFNFFFSGGNMVSPVAHALRSHKSGHFLGLDLVRKSSM